MAYIEETSTYTENVNAVTQGDYVSASATNTITTAIANRTKYLNDNKFNIAQGSENSGKFAYVNSSGNLTVFDTHLTFDSDGNMGQDVSVTPITAIEIDETSATIEKRTDSPVTQNYTATITPSTATNKNLVWASSNPSVILIDPATGEGKVKSTGSTTISVTTQDGTSLSDSETITVKRLVDYIYLTGTIPVAVYAGATYSISASVSPSTATLKTYVWASSNTSVATVNTSGRVTVLDTGSFNITATANDNSGVVGLREFEITKIYVSSVTVSGDIPSTTTAGSTYQLTATVLPSNATVTTLTWTSNSTSAATVDSTGLVTIVNGGTFTITAKATDGSNKSGTKTFTSTVVVPVESVTVSGDIPSEVEMLSEYQLTATVEPATATVQTVTWSCSDPAVATVDEDSGLVTILTSGTFIITATSDESSSIYGSKQFEVTAS